MACILLIKIRHIRTWNTQHYCRIVCFRFPTSKQANNQFRTSVYSQIVTLIWCHALLALQLDHFCFRHLYTLSLYIKLTDDDVKPNDVIDVSTAAIPSDGLRRTFRGATTSPAGLRIAEQNEFQQSSTACGSSPEQLTGKLVLYTGWRCIVMDNAVGCYDYGNMFYWL